MKPILKTSTPTAIAVALVIVLSFTACKKDKTPVDMTKKASVQLTGSQEVPPNSSTGTGSAQVSFNPDTKIITYSMTWQLGVSTATTTNMHFHGAADGTDSKSSPPVIGITGFTTASSGSISGTTSVLTDEEINQLLAGKWYLNIHSTTVPGGELRGNIKF